MSTSNNIHLHRDLLDENAGNSSENLENWDLKRMGHSYEHCWINYLYDIEYEISENGVFLSDENGDFLSDDERNVFFLNKGNHESSNSDSGEADSRGSTSNSQHNQKENQLSVQLNGEVDAIKFSEEIAEELNNSEQLLPLKLVNSTHVVEENKNKSPIVSQETPAKNEKSLLERKRKRSFSPQRKTKEKSNSAKLKINGFVSNEIQILRRNSPDFSTEQSSEFSTTTRNNIQETKNDLKSDSTLTEETPLNINVESESESESSLFEPPNLLNNNKKVFVITKEEERQNGYQENLFMLLSIIICSIAGISIDVLCPLNKEDWLKTIDSNNKPSKIKPESKHKKIKAHVLKFLIEMLRLNDKLFNQKFITKANITSNNEMNEKTIEEIIKEALQRKLKNENVENKLNIIKERTQFDKKYLFKLKFWEFYQQEYFRSEECKKKLEEIFKDESFEYYIDYSRKMLSYIAYFREEKAYKKGTGKTEKNKGKRKAKAKKN